MPLFYRACLLGLAAAGACSTSTMDAVGPLLADESVLTKVDVLALLDPENKSNYLYEADPSRKLALAFRGFYLYTDQPLRRNRVQDALVAVSESQLHAWSSRLRDVVTSTGFGFSVSQVVLSGLSTVLSPVGTKTALSGAATVVGGMDEAFAREFFEEKALSAILRGIELKRAEVLTQILQRRVTGTLPTAIDLYTVEEAVQDVLRYHRAASVGAGLDAAAHAAETKTTETVAARVQARSQ